MTQTTSDVKQQVQEVLKNLPKDCSMEDVQYHLYVAEKVRQGLEAVDRGEGIAHEEARRRLSKWLVK